MRLFLFCFLIISKQACFGQNYVLPDSTLMVHITNSVGENVVGAELIIDGKAMSECKECVSLGSQEGFYFLKSSVYKNNVFQQAHMVVKHPGYQLYSDTIILYYPIVLRKPNEGYCYIGNKRPMIYGPDMSVAFVAEGKTEELMSALMDTHGTVVNSSNYCGDNEWNRGFGPNKYVIKHNSRSEAIAFQKMYTLSGTIAFMTSDMNDGSAFTREFTVQYYDGEAQGGLIKALLEKWLGQGKLESYSRANEAFTSNQTFRIKLTAEEIVNANYYIEAMQTTGRVAAYMEIFAFACLD